MIDQDMRTLIADDAYAMSFQSMGQYRTALLNALASAASALGEVPAGWKLSVAEDEDRSWLRVAQEGGREVAFSCQRGSLRAQILQDLAIALAASAAPVASKGAEAMCACGDRPASKCDEEWGPNCDLGNNPAHGRRAPAGSSEAVDAALGITRAAPAEPEAQKAVAKVRTSDGHWSRGSYFETKTWHVDGLKGIESLPDGALLYASPSPAASMEVQGLTDDELTAIYSRHYPDPIIYIEGDLHGPKAVNECLRDVQRALAVKNGWRLGEGRG